MARRHRGDAPLAFHAIRLEALDTLALFQDDDDREEFITRLSKVFSETETRCDAWALGTARVELLMQTGRDPISHVMQRIGTGYVRYFNRRHHRRGYLFNSRFESTIVRDYAQWLFWLRHIHRLPLREQAAAEPRSLDAFEWTGHSVLMGGRARPFFDAMRVLANFCEDLEKARLRLRNWMSTTLPSDGSSCSLEETRRELHAALRTLGFEVGELHRSLLPPRDLEGAFAPPGCEDLSNDEGFANIVEQALEELGIAQIELWAGRRSARVTRARALIAGRAAASLGLSGREIACRLGVSPGAVSRALSRERDERART